MTSARGIRNPATKLLHPSLEVYIKKGFGHLPVADSERGSRLSEAKARKTVFSAR